MSNAASMAFSAQGGMFPQQLQALVNVNPGAQLTLQQTANGQNILQPLTPSGQGQMVNMGQQIIQAEPGQIQQVQGQNLPQFDGVHDEKNTDTTDQEHRDTDTLNTEQPCSSQDSEPSCSGACGCYKQEVEIEFEASKAMSKKLAKDIKRSIKSRVRQLDGNHDTSSSDDDDYDDDDGNDDDDEKEDGEEEGEEEIVSLGLELAEIPEISEEPIEVSAEAKLRSTAPAGVKKTKVDSSVKFEFEQDIKKLNEWFERVESSCLELLVGDKDQDSFTAEEKCVFIEDSENEVGGQSSTIQRLIALGQTLSSELRQDGEPYENVTKSTFNLQKRWESLQKILSETKQMVKFKVKCKKIHDECNLLEALVGTFVKWAGSAEIIAEDAVDINKQVEQSFLKKTK